MKRNIESNIRVSVISIYIILAVVCCGMVFYISTFRTETIGQKQNIEQINKASERLIYLILQVHRATDMYISTKDEKYLEEFEVHSTEIKNIIYVMSMLSGDKSRYSKLTEIYTLIEGKKAIITELNHLEQDENLGVNNMKEYLDALVRYEQEVFILLIDIHREILDTIVSGINKNEKALKKNYRYMLIGGLLSLVLVLILIITIIDDVDKGRSLRKALEEANVFNQNLMENRHKFLLSISHDIKAPLASILGYVELWQQDPMKSKEFNGMTSIQNSGKYIVTLLENLLEFSSLEQGKMNAIKNDFDMELLCNEIAEMFSPLAVQRELSFNYKYDVKGELLVHSDRVKLKQLVSNLLSNAIKYTMNGEVAFKISYKNGNVHFSICDTGVGIPQDKIDILFQPFLRIEKYSTLAKGSGLGLYVVKGLVELFKGELTIDSKIGEGTCIEVRVPITRISRMGKPENKPLATQINMDEQYKIIVVDDDVSLLTMLKEMLSVLKHQAVVCASVNEFDQYLSRLQDFDIILTDMEMKGSSGSDLLNKVRAVNSDIPVIVMTARSEYGKNKALEDGFDAYLAKPFSFVSLSNTLIYTLHGKCYVPPQNQDYNMASLSEMFGGDSEAINNILKIFVEETAQNISLLRKHVETDNIKSAHYLCHKMLPMFAQIDAGKAVEILKKIDASRTKNGRTYPNWKEDIDTFVKLAEKLIENLFKG